MEIILHVVKLNRFPGTFSPFSTQERQFQLISLSAYLQAGITGPSSVPRDAIICFVRRAIALANCSISNAFMTNPETLFSLAGPEVAVSIDPFSLSSIKQLSRIFYNRPMTLILGQTS